MSVTGKEESKNRPVRAMVVVVFRMSANQHLSIPMLERHVRRLEINRV